MKPSESLDANRAAIHPELPLAFAQEMRNALACAYFKIDLIIVGKTVETDLIDLYEHVGKVLKSDS
jgi:uncharacterized protein with HEPN domain